MTNGFNYQVELCLSQMPINVRKRDCVLSQERGCSTVINGMLGKYICPVKAKGIASANGIELVLPNGKPYTSETNPAPFGSPLCSPS